MKDPSCPRKCYVSLPMLLSGSWDRLSLQPTITPILERKVSLWRSTWSLGKERTLKNWVLWEENTEHLRQRGQTFNLCCIQHNLKTHLTRPLVYLLDGRRVIWTSSLLRQRRPLSDHFRFKIDSCVGKRFSFGRMCVLIKLCFTNPLRKSPPFYRRQRLLKFPFSSTVYLSARILESSYLGKQEGSTQFTKASQ